MLLRFFAGDVDLSVDTPRGTKIINERVVTLYSALGSKALGFVARGAFGEVVGGPILIDDQLWWEVKYESGARGFVWGNNIQIDADRNRIAVKENTPRGTKVAASTDTDVYSSPVGGSIVGTVEEGEEGTIIGGPVLVDGERWWQVKYEKDKVGWVREDNLVIDTKRNPKALHDDTLFGTLIINTENISVYNTPRNGNVIGEQNVLALGKTVDGPVTVSTSRFWDIDYEIGVDGWVLEDSIERQFPVVDVAETFGAAFKKISIIVSIIFGVGIIILFFKLRDEISREYHMFKAISIMPQEHRAKNDTWKRVLEHLESGDPNNWRLAIMEADIMLEDMVDTMMLPGESLGERMTNIEQSDFNTIDKAWEAHKLRNKIVHEGGDYILTEREAKRIVSLYKEVFDEFHFI